MVKGRTQGIAMKNHDLISVLYRIRVHLSINIT